MADGMFSKLINPDTAQPKVVQPTTTLAEEARPKIVSPTITAPKKQPKEVVKKTLLEAQKGAKRKQISAYLSYDQLQILKQLYFKLNSGDAEIEKSEIVGLAIEVLAQLLGTRVPRYSSTNRIREYLNTQISKYLNTQVPDNSST